MPSIDDDLSQIERDIRTLKIEYEQFFGGGRKRPPSDTQWRLETTVRRCAEQMGELNYAQRFRYNSLLQTYAKYQDMWRKKLIQKESGAQQRHFGAAAKAIEAERARTASEHPPSTEQGTGDERKKKSRRAPVFTLQFDLKPESAGEAAPMLDSSKVEELYRKLIEAQAQTGERASVPTRQDFERFVQQKTRELQGKGAHKVEYTVTVEGGRVKLRARISS
jgi:hypothetical protein